MEHEKNLNENGLTTKDLKGLKNICKMILQKAYATDV